MTENESDDVTEPSENGHADDDPEVSVEDGAVEGESTSGQSTGGQSSDGQSTGGQSTGGQSAGGQSAGGQSAGAQSTSGQSAGGQSAGAQSAGGQSAGGQSAGGQSTGQTGGQNAGGGEVQPDDSMTGPAAGGTDLDANVAAALAYVFAPLSGVVMLLLEGDDDFVRFHSIQSIGYGAAVIGIWVAVGIVFGVLTAIPFVGDIFAVLALPVNGLVGLAALGGWALLVFKSYQGERYGLPVLGPMAASN